MSVWPIPFNYIQDVEEHHKLKEMHVPCQSVTDVHHLDHWLYSIIYNFAEPSGQILLMSAENKIYQLWRAGQKTDLEMSRHSDHKLNWVVHYIVGVHYT